MRLIIGMVAVMILLPVFYWLEPKDEPEEVVWES